MLSTTCAKRSKKLMRRNGCTKTQIDVIRDASHCDCMRYVIDCVMVWTSLCIIVPPTLVRNWLLTFSCRGRVFLRNVCKLFIVCFFTIGTVQQTKLATQDIREESPAVSILPCYGLTAKSRKIVKSHKIMTNTDKDFANSENESLPSFSST